MKRILVLSLIICFFVSCEKYRTGTNLTLSGKYVLSLLDVTSENQNDYRDSLYRPGSIYKNKNLPNPFDSMVINRFYIHLTYSEVRMNLLENTPNARDIWQYGDRPNEIFYRVYFNNTYNNGILSFTYISKDRTSRTMNFLIEQDGIESLQLRLLGTRTNGENQTLTMVFSRVGP
jgi:hypothetical protein